MACPKVTDIQNLIYCFVGNDDVIIFGKFYVFPSNIVVVERL